MSGAVAPDPEDVPSRFHVQFEGKTLLGIYRVDRKLADGGMGSVYLAQDTNLGRRVVVKVPHLRFLGEPGFRSRFRREVAELVRLEHPHVVRILAQGEEDEIPYFVLQYLGGGSLEDRLRTGVERPEAVLGWLRVIAETLDFVHGRGVVHRDVKPGNILFDEQGHVFLSDFGVVKALERDASPNLTEAGTGIGSPFYMAPEQALGRGLSASSDQYALASTLFESLAGTPPFGRGTLLETVLRKDREAAPSLRATAPAVPEACDAAVAKALARDPAQRFPSCEALAEAYRLGIAGAITAPVPSPSARGVRRPVAALVVFATLAVGAGVGATTGWYGLARGTTGPGAPPAAAPTGDAARVLAQLVRPGAEPRRVLRVRPVVDARESCRSVGEQTFSITLGKTDPQRNAASLEQDIDVHVKAIEQGGVVRLEWVFHAPKASEPSGAAADDVGRMSEKISAALGDVVGESVVSPRGVTSEVALRRAKEESPSHDPLINGFLAGFEDMARSLFPTLPEEAVGVGAEWDVAKFVRTFGMRYHQTTTYTLLESDGDRVRLRLRQSYAAPSQGLEFGREVGDGMPETTMRSLVGSGEDELTFDLGRALPLSYESKGSLSFESAFTKDGKENVMRFEKGFVLRLKRK